MAFTPSTNRSSRHPLQGYVNHPARHDCVSLKACNRVATGAATIHECTSATAPTTNVRTQLASPTWGRAPDVPIDVNGVRGYLCRVVGHDISPEDWAQLLPGRPYRRVCAEASTD
jgi:hypothetical protein